MAKTRFKHKKFDTLVQKIEAICNIPTAPLEDSNKAEKEKKLTTDSLFLKVYKFKDLVFFYL